MPHSGWWSIAPIRVASSPGGRSPCKLVAVWAPHVTQLLGQSHCIVLFLESYIIVDACRWSISVSFVYPWCTVQTAGNAQHRGIGDGREQKIVDTFERRARRVRLWVAGNDPLKADFEYVFGCVDCMSNPVKSLSNVPSRT